MSTLPSSEPGADCDVTESTVFFVKPSEPMKIFPVNKMLKNANKTHACPCKNAKTIHAY